MTRFLHFVVFVVGLAAICWIGSSYVASNPLALSITALIGVVYLVGALELYRYQQATSSLVQSLDSLSEPASSLDEWLARLHPSLRTATRLRIEGERVGLPGPSLTPYLVGLLVLLGMLGTFLGMVATLRGTGLALEGATDLHAIQASLAAPVKGLGFAFGTSVAGVASSAMLGLLSALCRRERVRAAQMLDAKIATTLRPYSLVHQREEGLRLMQRQADALPAVADRLQEMMSALAQHSQALGERIEQHNLALNGRIEQHNLELNSRMEQHSVALNERMERHSVTLNERMAQDSLALSDRIGQYSQALSERIEQYSQTLGECIEQHSQALNARMETQSQALGEQLASGQTAFHANTEAVYTRLATSVEQSLRDGIAEGARAAGAAIQPVVEGTMASLAREGASLHETVAQTVQQQMAGMSAHAERTTANLAGVWDKALADISTRLAHTTEALSASWREVLALQERSNEKLAGDNQSALSATVAAFEQHSATLLGAVDHSHAELRTALLAQDDQRLAAWTESLGAMATRLREELEQTQAQAASHQQAICDALAQTASAVSSATQAHASATITEIERLVQAASEAPKLAADVVIEVRQKLSDSMARDNVMLEERGRLLETLGTLLDAVNHASTEQRAAVDALVATSADMLERVGSQFTDSVETVTGRLTSTVDTETARLTDMVVAGTGHLANMVQAETSKLAGSVETETGRLSGIAAQVTGSAVEVASLGEAFGTAVQLFSESNASLVEHLQRLEATLDKSIARSDEQLAYYVAQAREVVDLSMMSQKQIMEELQQLAGQRAAAGTEAA